MSVVDVITRRRNVRISVTNSCYGSTVRFAGNIQYIKRLNDNWARSSTGRAPDSKSGGWGFKSSRACLFL